MVGNWAGCIASSALAPSYWNPTECKNWLSHSVAQSIAVLVIIFGGTALAA